MYESSSSSESATPFKTTMQHIVSFIANNVYCYLNPGNVCVRLDEIYNRFGLLLILKNIVYVEVHTTTSTAVFFCCGVIITLLGLSPPSLLPSFSGSCTFLLKLLGVLTGE